MLVLENMLPTNVMLFIRVLVMSTCWWNVGQITTDCFGCLPWCGGCYSINCLTTILRQLARLRHSGMYRWVTKFHHFSHRCRREMFGRILSSSNTCTVGILFIIIRLKIKVVQLVVLALVEKATAKKCLLHQTMLLFHLQSKITTSLHYLGPATVQSSRWLSTYSPVQFLQPDKHGRLVHKIREETEWIVRKIRQITVLRFHIPITWCWTLQTRHAKVGDGNYISMVEVLQQPKLHAATTCVMFRNYSWLYTRVWATAPAQFNVNTRWCTRVARAF